jgi:acetyl-CoA acyltransferase
MGLKLKMFLVTVNRYCASGLETIGGCQNPVRNGTLYCAGGAESMSFDGLQLLLKAGNEDYYWGMGLTAEACNSLSF